MWFLGFVLVVGCVIGALLAWSLRRAAQTATTGQPTPEEVRIKTDIDHQVEFIKEEDAREQSEVMHADRDGLLARLRGLVRGKK